MDGENMVLNPIKTHETYIEYFEDDSTAPPVEYYTYTDYPNEYYQDVKKFLHYPAQTARGKFASTNKTVGIVKLRLSPREM